MIEPPPPPSDDSVVSMPSRSDQTSRIDWEKPTQYKDVFWLALFVVHLVVVIIVAAMYGSQFSSAQSSSSSSNTINGTLSAILLVSLAIGAVIGIVWLFLVRLLINSIIALTIVLAGLALLGIAILNFISGNIAGGVFLVILSVLLFVFLGLSWSKIPLATSILKMSLKAIATYPGALYVVYMFIPVLVGWLVFWVFVVTSVNTLNAKLNAFYVFLLLLSLYWTAQVIKNIVHVTCAGVAATWYFSPHVPSATLPALKRACTTSLGSICLGSIIIAMLQTFKTLLSTLNGRETQCVRCLLDCVEKIMRFFNMYAFTFVAIYGMDFTQAAHETWRLLQSQAISVMVNNDLTQFVVIVGCGLGGGVAALIGVLWGWQAGLDNYGTAAFYAFLLAFVMTSICLSIITSSVASIFVCYAVDPNALRYSHPDEYVILQDYENKTLGLATSMAEKK